MRKVVSSPSSKQSGKQKKMLEKSDANLRNSLLPLAKRNLKVPFRQEEGERWFRNHCKTVRPVYLNEERPLMFQDNLPAKDVDSDHGLVIVDVEDHVMADVL